MNAISPVASSRKSRYALPAIFLHWLLAILIVGMIGLGWYMMSIEDSPGSDWNFMLHKSIGLIIIVLVMTRILWRAWHQPATLPKDFPRWQVMAANMIHWLLYLAMIAMPLAGLAGATLSKKGVSFFGFALPRFIAANHDLAEIFFSLHSIIAWIFVMLISLHVVAAVKHLISNDGTFQRMWFPRKTGGAQ